MLLRAGMAGGWQRLGSSVWVPPQPRPLSWGTVSEDPPPPATATTIPFALAASPLSLWVLLLCLSVPLFVFVFLCLSLPLSLSQSPLSISVSISVPLSHTHTHTHTRTHIHTLTGKDSLSRCAPRSAAFIPQSHKSLLWVPHSLSLHYICSATLSHPPPQCHPIPDDPSQQADSVPGREMHNISLCHTVLHTAS